MKKLILAIALLATTSAFAQRTRQTTTTTTTTTPVESYRSSSYGGQNELTANLGMASSALNLGLTFAHITGNAGFGGYFQFQTEKTPATNQMIALGGLYKINVVNAGNASVYLAPGFGLAMVKVPTPATALAAASTSDKTVIGASLKIGAQYRFTPMFALGVEQSTYSNWFDDTVSNSADVTALSMTFNL